MDFVAVFVTEKRDFLGEFRTTHLTCSPLIVFVANRWLELSSALSQRLLVTVLTRMFCCLLDKLGHIWRASSASVREVRLVLQIFLL